MKNFETVREELKIAEENCEKLREELTLIEFEKMASIYQKIYRIPVQWTVHAEVVVPGNNLKEAIYNVYKIEIPVGGYIDDSWEVNPYDQKEEELLEGHVK
jgi:hypothetical protein